jgi:hypothetical protein
MKDLDSITLYDMSNSSGDRMPPPYTPTKQPPPSYKQEQTTTQIATLPERQPRMDTARLYDSPTEALTSIVPSCLFGLCTFGIGGLMFLFCINGIFARVGIVFGAGLSLVIIAALQLDLTSTPSIIASSLSLAFGTSFIVIAIILYRKARIESLPNIV